MKTTAKRHSYSYKGSLVKAVIDKRDLLGLEYLHLECLIKTPGEEDAKFSMGVLAESGGTSLDGISERDKELIHMVVRTSRLSAAANRN